MEIKLHKMRTRLEDEVKYSLMNGDETIDMNALIGQPIQLKFSGKNAVYVMW